MNCIVHKYASVPKAGNNTKSMNHTIHYIKNSTKAGMVPKAGKVPKAGTVPAGFATLLPTTEY